MKIILANCPIKNGNRGCMALSYSAIYVIDELLRKKKIEYSFYLPQSGYDDFSEHTITMGRKELRFFSCRDISRHTAIDCIRKLYHWKRYVATLRIYATADFVFDIGLGDSFSDIYGKDRFYSIFAQYKLGKLFHIPYCILPQTIGPFKNPEIKEKAKKGISWAKSIMTRDKQSSDYVDELLPGHAVSELVDIAFFMPYMKKTFNPSYIHVGLNVSALLWHGGYTRDNQFGLQLDYQKLVYDIIDYFLSLKNVKLHLIPHVVGVDRNVENDYAVSYDLYEKYHHNNLILSPLFLDPIAAKGYIAGMDFFMGARMHAAIGAFSSGVPVLPIGYSRKFNGLFVDTLDYKDMIDMKDCDNDSAIALVKQCFSDRKKEKAIIEDRMNTVVAKKKEMLLDGLEKFMGIV